MRCSMSANKPPRWSAVSFPPRSTERSHEMSKDDDWKMLLPTYALRAWLTALLGATERAREEVNSRVESHEKEIARLRAQMQRGSTVITSLRAAIGSVDDVLRRTRDVDVKSESPRTHSE